MIQYPYAKILFLIATSLSGCVDKTFVKTPDIEKLSLLEGTIKNDKEMYLYNYNILDKSNIIDRKSCINGILSTDAKATYDKLSLYGKKVKVYSKVLDYIDFVNEDPIKATLIQYQNSCQNKNFLIVVKIEE